MDLTNLIENLTEDERNELRLAARAVLAKQEFLPYVQFIEPNYEVADHLRLLTKKLEKVERGEIKRLIITTPPRHGKSFTTTGMFPGWVLGRHPEWVVMVVSHSADLAETFSIQNRDTIVNNPRWPLVFPDVVINPSMRSASKWAVNNARESLIANGIMGGLTGYGANLIIFDDPIKTYEQAQSPTYRDKVYNEYKSSARTRLMQDGRIIIIMTRWHDDDLVARILNSPEGNQWDVLHLPAFSYGVPEDYEKAYPNELERTKVTQALPKTAYPDPLGRPKGEPLWPSRWPTEFLNDQQLALQHQFTALYQGHPSQPEGQKFKRVWFRPITSSMLAKLKAKPIARARSYDLAWSEKQRADFTAGLRGTLYRIPPLDEADDEVRQFITDNKIQPVIVVLEDLLHWRREWDAASEDLVRQALEDTEDYQMLVEAVASQNIAFKSFRRDPRLMGHSIVPITVTRDKEARMSYPLRLASRGFVFIQYPNVTSPPEWEDGFLTELGQMPHAPHDDRADAFTQLVNYWQGRIDNILRKTNYRQWQTPFTRAKKSTFGRGLPPEFSKGQESWQRDKLGWA